MAEKKLTLQHFKDEVAKEYTYSGNHYKDWGHMWRKLIWDTPGGMRVQAAKDLQIRSNEAAERYAQYLAGEAWEEGYSQGYDSGYQESKEEIFVPQPDNPYKQKDA